MTPVEAGPRGCASGQVFDAETLLMPVLPGTAHAGLLVLARSGCPLLTQRGARRLLFLTEGRCVLHVPTPRPIGLAHQLRRTPGALGVALHPAGPVTVWTRLALGFAAELSGVWAAAEPRKGWHPTGGAGVTSASPGPPPDLGPSTVRIMHLLSVRSAGQVQDEAVWEWVSRAEAEAWYGGPLPDMDPIHRRLPALRAVRKAAREGRLPATPLAQHLVHALGTREFSGLFVLEYHNLVRAVLTDVERLRRENP